MVWMTPAGFVPFPTSVPMSPGLVFSALALSTLLCVITLPRLYLVPTGPAAQVSLTPLPESLLPPKHSCPPCLFLSAAISPPSPIPLILLTPYHSAPIPLTGHHLGGAHQQTRSGESVTGRRRRRIEPRRQAGGHAASRCHGAGSRRRRRQRRWPAVWVDQSLMAPGEALDPAQGGASPPRFRSSGRHKRWGQALLGVGGPVQLPPSDDGAA